MWLHARSEDNSIELTIDVDPYPAYYYYRPVRVMISGKQCEIFGVNRLRDGGTTNIKTNYGTIRVASPYKGGHITLNGRYLERIENKE